MKMVKNASNNFALSRLFSTATICYEGVELFTYAIYIT